MGTNNNLDEAFFESMFEKGNLDQPSEAFTSNVMNLINKEAVKEKEANQPIIGYTYMALIGMAFIAAAYIIFGMELPSFNSLFGEISFNDIQILSLGSGLIESVSNIFASIQVPSILIVVTVAIISLIGLDRMLKRPMTTHLFCL